MATSGKEDSIYQKFSKSAGEAQIRPSSAAKDKLMPYKQLQRKPVTPPFSADKDQPSHVSVHIAGMQYRLIAPDKKGEAYVREIAEKAEQLILQIQKNSPGMSMTSTTVLSLVNVLDEMHKKDLQYADLEREIASHSVTTEKDKANFLHLREINWELKKEVLRLQSVIDAYENTDADEFEQDVKKKLLPLEELEFDILEQESCND